MAPRDAFPAAVGGPGTRAALAATFFFWASLFVYAPILPAYAAARGASLRLVGIIVGAYGVTQGLLRLPLGVASDRWGCARGVVLAGLAAIAAGGVVLALGLAPLVLVAGRVLTGAGAATWVALLVLAVGTYPAERLTDAMSAVAIAATLAEVGAVLAGGLLADHVGWAAPFYASAALAACGLAPALGLPAAARPESRETSWARVVAAVRRPRLLVTAALTALVTLTIYVSTYGFVPVLAVERGATRTDLGVLGTLAQAGFAAGALLTARAARHVTPAALLITGAGLVALSSALIPVAPGMRFLQATQALGGIGRGLVNPIAATVVLSDVPESDRTTTMGIYQVGWSTGIFLGPPLAGWIADLWGLPAAFLTGAAASLVAVGLGGWLWLEARRP
jgi:predicted MFS family arabinose efflux permease